MFRISNTVVGVLNILTLLLGLATIGESLYIHSHGANATDCQKVLLYPLLIGGLFVVLVSILGIVGSLCRVNVALYIYLFLTFLLIVGLILLTIFALFITNKRVGQHVSGKGYNEYKITDFSHWLQHYVINDKNWDEVKSCLMDTHVCQNLPIDGARRNDSKIYMHWSTTQSGCCKPPVYCGFTMKNATFWVMPKTGPAVKDSDCNKWNNSQDKLCYDCNSCKGGVLANIRSQWKHLTIFNVCTLVLVTVIYSLGCYAVRNNRLGSHHKCQKHRSHPL